MSPLLAFVEVPKIGQKRSPYITKSSSNYVFPKANVISNIYFKLSKLSILKYLYLSVKTIRRAKIWDENGNRIWSKHTFLVTGKRECMPFCQINDR